MNTFECPDCKKIFSTENIPSSAKYVTVVCDACKCQMNVYPRAVIGYRIPRVEKREKNGVV